jgi:hypothetical protein
LVVFVLYWELEEDGHPNFVQLKTYFYNKESYGTEIVLAKGQGNRVHSKDDFDSNLKVGLAAALCNPK